MFQHTVANLKQYSPGDYRHKLLDGTFIDFFQLGLTSIWMVSRVHYVLCGGSLPRLKSINSHLGNAQVQHVFMLAFTGTCVSSNIASSFVMTASNPTIHIMQR